MSYIPFWVTVTLTSDLVVRILCSEHISYILWGRNSKFGVYMHLGMVESHILFLSHCDLDLWPSFNNSVRSISLLFWDRNPKFGVWMHLGMVECLVPFTGHYDLDLWPSFNNNCVRSLSLFIFEIGIPNLVCECILGWWSVLYHLQFTVTLTFGLVFLKIMSRAYLLYY